MTICACGCGQEIPYMPHHKYKPPKFLPGHHVRTKDFLETREKLKIKPPANSTPSGFCECGCGQRTKIAKQTRSKFGEYNGYPQRFIHGHHPKGKRSSYWKGGRKQNKLGYWLIFMPDHHLANGAGYIPEHRLVWEQTNGRRLKPNEHVHHIDGNPENNDPSNLIALTKREHAALHGKSEETQLKKSSSLRQTYQDPDARKRLSEGVKRSWKKRRN